MINNSLAFVFPGQGSQAVGMLSALAAEFAEVGEVFAEASEVLGYDLWNLVQNGPTEQLNLTQYTQPAMLAAGVAIWKIWLQQQPHLSPGWMAGHSLGEYSALVCSGALEFKTAVKLVAERGRLMQAAVPAGTGAMAAILGLDDPPVVHICQEVSTADETVTPANFNAPGQVVIAGHKAAVTRAIAALKSAGAKRAVELPVSVPSHCALMTGAAEELCVILDSIAFASPSIPVVHNFDVATHAAPEVLRSVLQKQLYNPVRWSDSVKFMHEQSVMVFVECGPGKVLSGLNKRIAPNCQIFSIADPESLKQTLEFFA